MFVFVALLSEKWSRGKSRFYQITGRERASERIRLRGTRVVLAITACSIPLALGFLVPGAQLCFWTITTWPDVIDHLFNEYSWHSISLAAVTALLAVSLAVILRYSLSDTNFGMIFLKNFSETRKMGEEKNSNSLSESCFLYTFL